MFQLVKTLHHTTCFNLSKRYTGERVLISQIVALDHVFQIDKRYTVARVLISHNVTPQHVF